MLTVPPPACSPALPSSLGPGWGRAGAGCHLLTHIVDGAIVTAKEEEGASGIIAGDGLNLLDL